MAKPRKPVSADEPDGFAEFWAPYPKKDGKQDAMKAFKQRHLHDQTDGGESNRALLMAGLRRWVVHEKWTKEAGKYVPMPGSFLRGMRWLDATVCGNPAMDTTNPPEWVTDAGFDSVHEAGNFRCYAHNAHEFRDRKRIPAVEGAPA